MSTKTEQSIKPISFISFISGALAGMAAVVIDNPLWVIKTLVQSPNFTWKQLAKPANQTSLQYTVALIKQLYKGGLTNLISLMPTTSVQVGLNQLIPNLLYRDTTTLTSIQHMNVAFISGVGSAFVSSPTERIMTLTLNNARPKLCPAQYLTQQSLKFFYTGLLATCIRDGFFAMAFLGITPLLKTKIQKTVNNDYAASLMAGVIAGIGATAFTHASDVVKTRQQLLLTPQSPASIARTIYRESGYFGFFKGIVPRGLRVTSAVLILSNATPAIEHRLSTSISQC